jgi:hypothetical protein
MKLAQLKSGPSFNIFTARLSAEDVIVDPENLAYLVYLSEIMKGLI